MNKKAELTDMFIFVITLFILAIGLFIFIYFIPTVSNGLRSAGLNNSVEGANAIDSFDGLTGVINNGFLMLFIGLIMSVLITSFLVRTHPIFLFLYIFFLIITMLLSVYLGNAYNDFENNPLFATALANAGFLHWVMNYIVEISLAVGALSMIIIFAKFSTFGGTQQF
jgi:hypothetical protein